MQKRRGKQTVMFSQPVYVVAASSVVGQKEFEGPLGKLFDKVHEDATLGKDSWEKAESELVRQAVNLCSCKSEIQMTDFEYIIAGDLLNQSTGSVFGLRETNRPYLGIFGACSAMGEGMSIGATLIDGGFAANVMAVASSHFCSAEKQFRFPLDFGTQRAPTSSWTVTGSAAVALTSNKPTTPTPTITAATTGKIIDMGITDAANMGAAMAGAAADTIATHFKDTGRNPNYYDLIITGDLGYVGSEIMLEILSKEGYEAQSKHKDCGIEIYDQKAQGTLNGGSGCGCSGVVFAAHYLEQLKTGKLQRILFVPTGALMSPVSVQQNESIPGIAHAVAIENEVM